MPQVCAFLPLLALLLPFAAGVTLTVAQSLGWGVPGVDAISLEGWRALGDSRFVDSLLLGGKVAGLSSLLSVGLGAWLAYAVWRLPLRLQCADLLGRIPLILPHVAVAWLVILLCGQSGLFSAAALHFGLIEGRSGFPALLYGGDGMGMVIAYVWKETPFVMLLVLASLRRLDPRLLEMGRMLGGGSWRIIRGVVLPHIAPVLHISFGILFLYALGAVEIPLLLGEVQPVMPGIEAYQRYFHMGLEDRPPAMALMTALLMGGIVAIVAYAALGVWLRDERRMGGHPRPEVIAAAPLQPYRPSRSGRQGALPSTLFLVGLAAFFGLPLSALAVQAAAPGWSWPELWPGSFSGRTLAWLSGTWLPVLRHLGWSLWYSLLVTALCLVVCIAPAHVLAFGRFRGKALLEGLLLAPAVLPAMGFALGLHWFLVGIDAADTTAGVVLVLGVVAYPYMLRALVVGWQTVGREYGRCACNLGAGRVAALLRIELPLLAPAVIAGGTVVFLVAFSDYFLVYLVGGGRVPSFTGYLFPVLQSGDRSLAAMLTLLFMCVPVLLFVLVELLLLAYYRQRDMA